MNCDFVGLVDILPIPFDREVIEPANGIAIVHVGWQTVHAELVYLILAVIFDGNGDPYYYTGAITDDTFEVTDGDPGVGGSPPRT